VLGRADIEARDDEDAEAEHRRLNTGDGAPFAIPGLCLVARLGMAAQNSQVLDGASGADIVGDLVDFSVERLGTHASYDLDCIVACIHFARERSNALRRPGSAPRPISLRGTIQRPPTTRPGCR